jgi:hypothetical protein
MALKSYFTETLLDTECPGFYWHYGIREISNANLPTLPNKPKSKQQIAMGLNPINLAAGRVEAW